MTTSCLAVRLAARRFDYSDNMTAATRLQEALTLAEEESTYAGSPSMSLDAVGPFVARDAPIETAGCSYRVRPGSAGWMLGIGPDRSTL